MSKTKTFPGLEEISLLHGAHKRRTEGVCALEAVAWLAGERHSDRPECVSVVIAEFVRTWNDCLPDDATRDALLKPLLLKLIGTKTTDEDETTRANMATDWLARECAPAWLRLAGLTAQAETLERLAPLNVDADFVTAQPTLNKVRDDALAAESAAESAARSAARSAAWSAAESAAESAARSAAWSAARSAAESAAWSAAWSAARSAARSAAWSAAEKALAPTTTALQASAVLLVERMCAVGRPTNQSVGGDR